MTWLGVAALVAVMMAAHGAQAAGPALTTISDTVYRADGAPAAGTVLISWPAFQTAEGDAVAAGNQSVAIGTGGTFTTQLVPNVGASPAGTYYTVVYQLNDYTVRTEYWSVPATATTTITAVRTAPGVGVANPAATQQYVNSAVANRALDAQVVHLGGAETITGTKQFAVPPVLPTPVGNNDATTKAYVDGAVSNVGAGSYVAKSGDTMSGPLVLPGDPTALNQAANRHYVDTGLAAKANLVGGVVPPNQLGSGVANASTCLTGNSTWGACGGGAPAGVSYASTSLNWSQTIASGLTGGTAATVTLTPCPAGVDTTSGVGYDVLVSGGGNSEAANVTGGTCSSGGASGTIVFTPYFSYGAGATVGSASSGIQETINVACGTDPTAQKNNQCNVTVPANGPQVGLLHSINTYSVAGTIYLHSNQSVLNGYGVSLDCIGRGACIQVGDLKNSTDFSNNTIQGFAFRSPIVTSAAYTGSNITNTMRTSHVATITTAGAHGFRPGDMVTILFTDNNAYWGDAVVTAAPTATTFTYLHQGGDIAAQATPGVVALAYVAVLDNAMNTHLNDLGYDFLGMPGTDGSFNNFFDFWDDENATIEHFNNNARALNQGATWTGSFVFSGGNPPGNPPGTSGQQAAAVITMRDSTITANGSNGVTVYNSNGVYVDNTVIQAQGLWEVYSSNSTGNYQGAGLRNIYSEAVASINPVSPARTPFPGTGVAGLIAGQSTAAAQFSVSGAGGMSGRFASGGSGSTTYSYFIVVNDATAGTQSSPLQVMNYSSTGSDAITVLWPRVANRTDTITYDVLRTTTTTGGVGSAYPSAGNCLGGSAAACGAVARNVPQCSGLVCSFTDSGNAVTQSYTFAVYANNYNGNLGFWPGSIVSMNKPVTVDTEHTNVVGIGLAYGPLQLAKQCSIWGQTSGGGYTSCASSITSATNAVAWQTAMFLPDGNANGGDHSNAIDKGRLNFTTSPWAVLQPHHFITLVDSNPALTRATIGYRPAASASDVWIGTDVSNNSGGVPLNAGQLAFGAPVAITNYINAIGDGTTQNWQERLTASLKEFNVAAKFDQNVTVSGSVAANGGLILPQGTGYVPGSGGLGLDTTSGLPVVNSGGATHQIAYTSSNISGQAGTALALAATPTQCSGAFATGIQANGNANCTTPNVIQLAETAAPAGIPNWGVFWFDSATHTPRVIDNNGQVTQLGLTNIFNSDPGGDPANNVEQKNGNNPQSLRVYSSYSNDTNWQRTSLGYDATDSYAVVRSENATSGSAAGLGFWIGSGLKWAIDPIGTLKPWTDNQKDIGSATLRVHNLYLGSGLYVTNLGDGCLNVASGLVGSSGTPCGGALTSVFGRTGTVTGQSGDYTCAQVTNCTANTTTVNGHALSGDVVVAAADLGAGALANGVTATTQAAGDTSTKLATTAFVQSAIPTAGVWMTTATGGAAGATMPSSANKMMLWGVVNPLPLTTTKVTYSVGTADNTSNTYDIGIYNSSGALVVHIGSTAGTTFAPSLGAHTLNWLSSASLPPGRYYIGYTSSCTASCATLSSPSANGFTFYKAEASAPLSIASGGTCPNSITAPADSPSWAAYVPALMVQ